MTQTSWHSYPKIWNMGHNAIRELFLDEVTVEEKVDGSQFSFGKFEGQLRVRSKSQEMNIDAPEKMFTQAIDTVKLLADKLIDGYTYRAEYLQKPKHNVLAYDRVPEKNLILFDVNTGEETYIDYDAKKAIADSLTLECVPLLFRGKIETFPEAVKILDTMSILGSQKIEGFVVKNYARFGIDKKVLMGKHVSDAFKEVAKGDWRERNPLAGDIIEMLIMKYRTPARWQKAVQHLKESGQLLGEPKDIGPLMKEANLDFTVECSDEIKEALFEWAMPKIARRVTSGLPEWYKTELLKSQFEEKK